MNEKIREWKQQYGKIYKVKVEGKEYIFRLLNIGEICTVLAFFQNQKSTEAEDIALKAVLYPEDFDPEDISPRISEKITNHVLEYTKVFSPTGVMELVTNSRARIAESMKNDFFKFKLTIMGIFPGYTMRELDSLNPVEFFDILTTAEEVTGKKLINDGGIQESMNKNEIKEEGYNPAGELEVSGDKFLSKHELDMIAADKATESLREHWMKYKK